jgi:acyl carrier protein
VIDQRFQRFIALVRCHLRLLATTEELDFDTPLRELGLDSMTAVRLVVALETELGVTLPEHRLTAETFFDAASLWRAVSTSSRPRPDGTA